MKFNHRFSLGKKGFGSPGAIAQGNLALIFVACTALIVGYNIYSDIKAPHPQTIAHDTQDKTPVDSAAATQPDEVFMQSLIRVRDMGNLPGPTVEFLMHAIRLAVPEGGSWTRLSVGEWRYRLEQTDKLTGSKHLKLFLFTTLSQRETWEGEENNVVELSRFVKDGVEMSPEAMYHMLTIHD